MERTVCHVAAKGGQLELLQKIRDWAKQNLTAEDIRNKLLLATDNKGNTAWQVAAGLNKVAIMEELRDWANEYLATEEIRTF
jgi:hypothetical protein